MCPISWSGLAPLGSLPIDDPPPSAARSPSTEAGIAGDPVRPAVEAIDRLQSEVARVLRRTAASPSVSPAELEELTARVVELRAAVVRWHRALDRAEEAAATPARAPAPSSLDEPALLRALQGAAEGLAPRTIRQLLAIDHTTSSTTLSRLLADAVARGVVRRTGKGPGTRYHAVDGPRTD